MQIIEYFSSGCPAEWIERIAVCDWSAARFLADLLRTDRFQEVLDGELYILADGGNVVSFATLTRKDAIDDPALFPWIGFVYTSPEYRRKGHAGEVIGCAVSAARRIGYDRVYLCTDHVGFYERFGFTYMENRIDIYGEDDRIYYKELKEKDMKNGIIFDLDGTMWDSSELVAEAYSRGLEKMGYSLRLSVEDIRNAMGKTMTEIAHMYFDAIDPEHAVDIMVKCIEEEMEYLKSQGGVVYDGLEDTLIELKRRGHFLACVSNCQSGYIEDFYRLTGLGKYFDDLECWGNTDLPKAENIKLVVARNGIDKAVYIGDTMGDYNSAMGAGTLFIHAAYGFGNVPEGTAAISSIRDLPDAAEKLLNEVSDN